MFIEQFLQILTFYLQRGICLVIPNCQDNELSDIENLKVRFYLSKFKIDPENKVLIYGNSALCRFIINLQMQDQSKIDYIGSCILNIQIRNQQSLNDYLLSLGDNSPVKNKIMELLKEDCPICYEPTPDHCLPCKHLLCKSCCEQIHSCPLCRSNYSINNVLVLNKEINTLDEIKEDDDNMDKSMVNMKNIKIITENDFNQFCMNRFHLLLMKKGGVLKSTETDELFFLILYFPNEIIKLYRNTSICSEEVKCFIAAILYKIHLNNTLCEYINTPNRILRFLAVLYNTDQNNINDNNIKINFEKNYGKPDPKENILLKGGRSFRSLILRMVSQCKESDKIEEEFIRYEKKWKLIFKFTHFGESKNIKNYPIAFNYANSICNGKKITKERENTTEKINKFPVGFKLYDIDNTECMSTISGKVNKYIESLNEDIFDYLSDKPGLAFRLLRRISLTFEKSDKLKPFLVKIIPKMNFDQQVDLVHLFSSNKEEDHPNVVITSKSTIYWGKN